MYQGAGLYTLPHPRFLCYQNRKRSEMSDSVREHLRGTINYLSSKRMLLIVELQNLEETLKALTKEELTLPLPTRVPQPSVEFPSIYATISVRWGVFYYLAEEADGPRPLGVIAEALRAGGSPTKAVSFNSNVSAVLSQMTGKNEVTKTEQGFALSVHGRAVWEGIKKSDKFLFRSIKEELPIEHEHVETSDVELTTNLQPAGSS